MCAAISRWAEEEVQHGKALRRWCELADPSYDFAAAFAAFAARIQLPREVAGSIRGSRPGELLARCVVECGTSLYYSSLRDEVAEPVLRAITARIAADEFHHYRQFHAWTRLWQAREPLSAFGRIKVLAARMIESGDDELAFAWHCSTESGPALPPPLRLQRLHPGQHVDAAGTACRPLGRHGPARLGPAARAGAAARAARPAAPGALAHPVHRQTPRWRRPPPARRRRARRVNAPRPPAAGPLRPSRRADANALARRQMSMDDDQERAIREAVELHDASTDWPPLFAEAARALAALGQGARTAHGQHRWPHRCRSSTSAPPSTHVAAAGDADPIAVPGLPSYPHALTSAPCSSVAWSDVVGQADTARTIFTSCRSNARSGTACWPFATSCARMRVWRSTGRCSSAIFATRRHGRRSLPPAKTLLRAVAALRARNVCGQGTPKR